MVFAPLRTIQELAWRVFSPVLAEVWDDGHAAGYRDCSDAVRDVECLGPFIAEPEPTPNPYRRHA